MQLPSDPSYDDEVQLREQQDNNSDIQMTSHARDDYFGDTTGLPESGSFLDYDGTFIAYANDTDGQGGIEAPRYSLCHNISLTLKAHDTTKKAALLRQENFPASPTPQNADLDDLGDLDPEVLEQCAHDHSSPFSDTAVPSTIAQDEDDNIKPCSLFDDFLVAGEYQPIILPPGPNTTSTSSQPKQPFDSHKTAAPVLEEPSSDPDESSSGLEKPSALNNSSMTEPPPTPSRRGRFSSAEQQALCQAFATVDDVLAAVAQKTGRSIDAI